MEYWRIIHSSVRGRSHIKENLPNQDAVEIFPAYSKKISPPFICSIADGHGGKKYCFSDIGSQLAVKCANKIIIDSVFDGQWSIGEVDESYIRESIGKKIVELWRKEVNIHYNNFAPYSIFEDKRSYWGLLPSIEPSAYKMYGSTLISYFLYNDYLVILQLGDGDVLILFENGTILSPLSKPDELIANETFSLSSPAAWKNFVVKVIPTNQEKGDKTSKILCILISTDGYSNSFTEYAGYIQVLSDIRDKVLSHPGGVEMGINTINNELPKWLNDTSDKGSGDDISIVISFKVN